MSWGKKNIFRNIIRPEQKLLQINVNNAIYQRKWQWFLVNTFIGVRAQIHIPQNAPLLELFHWVCTNDG